MFLHNPLAEAYNFRGEAETFNRFVKAVLAVCRHGLYMLEDLCGT